MISNGASSKKLLEEYRIGKTIGEGAFSKVKVAYHRKTKQKVAIKIISKKRLAISYKKRERERRERERREDQKQRERERQKRPVGSTEPCKPPGSQSEGQSTDVPRGEREAEPREHMPGMLSAMLSKEVRLLQLLHHPNIIRLYQVIETTDYFYVVMQYAGGGEIIDYIAQKERLPEREARKYFRQMVSAIDHCHLCGVLHRDLKLENILLSSARDVLISDFGLGRSFQGANLCDTFCGTPLYAAPELVSGIKYRGPPADIWAMGVVLYAMVCGKPPFQAETMAGLYRRIKSVDFAMPAYCSKGLQDLIRKIFVKDPDSRIAMSSLRLHPWLLEGYNEPPPQYPPSLEQQRLMAGGAGQVDNCKSIGFDREAIVYTFSDVAPNTKLARDKARFIHKIEKRRGSRYPTTSSNGGQEKQIEYAWEARESQGNSDWPSSDTTSPLALSSLTDFTIGNETERSSKTNQSNEHEECSSTNQSYSRPAQRSGSVKVSRLNHGFPPLFPSNRGSLPQPRQGHNQLGHVSRHSLNVVHSTHGLGPSGAARSFSSALGTLPRQPIGENATLPGLLSFNTPRPMESSADAAAAVDKSRSVVTRRGQSMSMIIRKSSFGSSSKARAKANAQSRGDESAVRHHVPSVRRTFNIVVLTASMSPEELVGEIQRVLAMLNITHSLRQASYGVVAVCVSASERTELELDVVKLWLLSIYGIRIRRLSGSLWLYKQVHSSITASLRVRD